MSEFEIAKAILIKDAENGHWAEDAYPGIKDKIIKAIEEVQPVESGNSD